MKANSDGKDIHYGNNAFSQPSHDQLARDHATARDINADDGKSAEENIPLTDDKIIHDRFYNIKLAIEAKEKVGKGEHRQLAEQGDHRFSGTEYL